jgi:hypothetical protein
MEKYEYDCDRCHKAGSAEATHEGNAVTLMLNQGWMFWDDLQYCPDCHSALFDPYAEVD